MVMTLSACGTTGSVEADVDTENSVDSEWSDEGYDYDEDETEDDVEGDADPLDASAGTWNLNTEQSTLTWSASRLASSEHTGTVDITSGTLEVGETGFTGGEFVMDMDSITESNNNETFIKHVKSDDFFSVADFPESRFVITEVTPQDGNTYQVKGDLTIRGITNPIEFTATAQGDATVLAMSAEFEIDRTLWDIKFDSSSFVQNLGDKAIKDEIGYELDLVFEL